jgi:integrase/recombinase XerD
MNNKLFWSVFATQIRDFINFKRSLGYKYIDQERVLLAFDRFILAQGHTITGLTKAVADKWADRRLN